MPLFGIQPAGLLQTIFEDIGVAVAVIDTGKKVVFANRAALTMFNADGNASGRSFVDWRNTCRFEDHRGNEIPLEESVVIRALEEKQAHSREVHARLADGQTKWITSYAYPFSAMGLEGVLALSLDQTLEVQLRRAAAKLQKMEVLGTLSAALAHNFNNILDAIISNAALSSRRGISQQESQARLVEISNSAMKAAQLVKRLTQFSRIRELHLERVQVNDVVREAVSTVHPLIQENVALKTNLSEGLPAITADRSQIEQVLVNLIVNSLDAMPEGGDLSLSTELANAGSGSSRETVVVNVTDTGIGIPYEKQASIFEPFFTTKPGKGTGLGLSSAYWIMREHNGSIEAQSVPLRGATFRLSFPVHREARSHPSREVA